MGCHTWFYKKVNPQPTREDKINQFIEQTGEYCKRLETALNNDGFDWEDVDKWYPYGDRASVEKRLSEYKWMLENVEHYDDDSFIKNSDSPYIRDYFYEIVEDWLAPIDEDSKMCGKDTKYDSGTTCINGIYYSRVRRYGDIFRYRNYDTVIFSEDEMWKLINDNNIIIDDETKNKLKEFWTLYPDGMIYFG